MLGVVWEWAGWDEAWLVESIRARRKCKQGRLGRAVRARFSLFTDGWYWRAIEKCMIALLAFPSDQRGKAAWDLRVIGGYYFDFCTVPGDPSAPGRRDELERIFRRVFLPTLGDLVVKEANESRASCERRVELALGTASE